MKESGTITTTAAAFKATSIFATSAMLAFMSDKVGLCLGVTDELREGAALAWLWRLLVRLFHR